MGGYGVSEYLQMSVTHIPTHLNILHTHTTTCLTQSMRIYSIHIYLCTHTLKHSDTSTHMHAYTYIRTHMHPHILRTSTHMTTDYLDIYTKDYRHTHPSQHNIYTQTHTHTHTHTHTSAYNSNEMLSYS